MPCVGRGLTSRVAESNSINRSIGQGRAAHNLSLWAHNLRAVLRADGRGALMDHLVETLRGLEFGPFG